MKHINLKCRISRLENKLNSSKKQIYVVFASDEGDIESAKNIYCLKNNISSEGLNKNLTILIISPLKGLLKDYG